MSKISHDTTNHKADVVPVMSADETQAREYCKVCGWRSDWAELPEELQGPETPKPELEGSEA